MASGPLSTSKLSSNAGLRIILSSSVHELSARAATIICSRLLETPDLNIGVGVGATTAGTYQQLNALVKSGVCPVDRAHFVVFDEFFGAAPPAAASTSATLAVPVAAATLPSLSPSQQRRLGVSVDKSLGRSMDALPVRAPHRQELEHVLFEPSGISSTHIHGPDVAQPAGQAVLAFEQVLGARRADLVVLGLGVDGRLGWMGHPAAQRAADGALAMTVDISAEPSSQHHGYHTCVSSDLRWLHEAHEVLVLAVNRNKAELVSSVLADTKQASAASKLLHTHPHVTLLLDLDASSEIAALVRPPNLSVPGYLIVTENSASDFRAKRIICFSPHPDDSSISAGATLSFLSQSNEVRCCVCTTGHRAYIPNTSTAEERILVREEEARKEAAHMGATAVDFLRLPLYNRSSVVQEDDIRIVENYLLTHTPHLIIMPQSGDTHLTHRAVALAILRACQRITGAAVLAHPIEVWQYEGPWSTFTRGAYNVVVSVGADNHAKKQAAIREHKSQTLRTPYDRAADSLSLLRGAIVPESDLVAFGEQPVRLEERLELFYRRVLHTEADAVELIQAAEAQVQPQPFAKH